MNKELTQDLYELAGYVNNLPVLTEEGKNKMQIIAAKYKQWTGVYKISVSSNPINAEVPENAIPEVLSIDDLITLLNQQCEGMGLHFFIAE